MQAPGLLILILALCCQAVFPATPRGSPNASTPDLASGLSQGLYDGEFSYIYGLERLAQQANTGEYEYFLPDRLGSVRQVAGASGFPSFAQEFDPFGSLSGYAGAGGSAFGYAGEFSDPSGLIYLRARYYSPAQGRFITRDPFPGLISQPASLNPYAYALNNPVLYTDPSGENPFLLVGVLGGVLGGSLYGYGSQVIRNLNQGLCFWDALSYDISAGQVALYAGIGGFIVLGFGGAAVGIQALFGYLGISTAIGTTLSADGDPTNEIRTGFNVVYQVVQNGVTKYIGITNDFVRRAGEHMRGRNWIIEPIQGLENLSRLDAKAVEQVLIERYGLMNLYNQINSISPNNPIYNEAVKRGLEILSKIGK